MTELLSLELELSRAAGLWLLVVVKRYNESLCIRVVNLEHGLVIGREPGVGLLLGGSLVSRRHAIVRASDAGLEIQDISSNGTLVNGVQLQNGCTEVARECTLTVGGNVVRLQRL
jgi:pSer/pThr/pTyr-binding forkhead associated (FHA) protein